MEPTRGITTATWRAGHGKMGNGIGQPIAALIEDLKARGLLDSTLVVWASKFQAVRRSRRVRTVAITIRMDSRSGWPEAA